MPDPWSQHDAACARGEHTYTDPTTGYQVFTRVGLAARGSCCGAGCRHCPYAHEKVALGDRATRIQQPAWLSEQKPYPDVSCRLLFWSGGKDSYLTYLHLNDKNIVLVTTYDAHSGVIAHQDLHINTITQQARALGLPLIGIPLHPQRDYVEQLLPALDLVNCTSVAFGDLHLQHIRQWREETFQTHPRLQDLALEFPLWEADYAALLTRLAASPVTCVVSAVMDTALPIQVGDVFDAEFVARLPAEIDAFGENGEFHTEIRFG